MAERIGSRELRKKNPNYGSEGAIGKRRMEIKERRTEIKESRMEIRESRSNGNQDFSSLYSPTSSSSMDFQL